MRDFSHKVSNLVVELARKDIELFKVYQQNFSTIIIYL